MGVLLLLGGPQGRQDYFTAHLKLSLQFEK
jgi:hypothetical protein